MARGDNNVYVGKDGQVYRRTDAGGWQQYDGGQWSGAAASRVDSSTVQSLNRDAEPRTTGASRASQSQAWRSSGGSGASRAGRGRRHAWRRRGTGRRSAMTNLIAVVRTRRAVWPVRSPRGSRRAASSGGNYYAGRSSGDLEACVPFNFDVSIEEGGRILGVAATKHQWGTASWDVSGVVTGMDIVLETRTEDPRVPEPPAPVAGAGQPSRWR